MSVRGPARVLATVSKAPRVEHIWEVAGTAPGLTWSPLTWLSRSGPRCVPRAGGVGLCPCPSCLALHPNPGCWCSGTQPVSKEKVSPAPSS